MRRLIASLALFAFTACSKDPASPSTSVVGAYTLQTVNGSGLPFVVQAAGPRIEVVSETLVLNAAGAFDAATVLRTTNGTTVTTTTDNEAGTYSIAGTTATFRDSGGAVEATGTIGGGKLTLTQEGLALVFVKQ
jgi:hypothetical protein